MSWGWRGPPTRSACYLRVPSNPTASPSWPTLWKTRAAPTPTSSATCAGRGRTSAVAGSWTFFCARSSAMTERDWLYSRTACAPDRMLAFLLDERGVARRKAGRRQLRLLACGNCRWIWRLLGDEHRWVVEEAELFADGLVGVPRLRGAVAAARRVGPMKPSFNHFAAAQAAVAAARPKVAQAALEVLHWSFNAWARNSRTPGMPLDQERWTVAEAFQCGLMRDLYCNPFRSVQLESSWLTSNVVRLARAAHEERVLPAGTLKPVRLAILADALEDAGCTNAGILRHLRGVRVHVRGCWVVDLLLKTD